MKRWATIQVVTVQHGLGERAKKNPNTGESIAGPVTLSDEEMAKNRIDPLSRPKHTRSMTNGIRQRSADLSKITTPFLSCANWGGQGIHPRGNFNGFTEAPAKQKWLEVHGDTHWSLFSSGYGVALQKRFFDYFLKGIEQRMGQGAPCAAEHPLPWGEVRSPDGERVAASPNPVDEVLSLIRAE